MSTQGGQAEICADGAVAAEETAACERGDLGAAKGAGGLDVGLQAGAEGELQIWSLEAPQCLK